MSVSADLDVVRYALDNPTEVTVTLAHGALDRIGAAELEREEDALQKFAEFVAMLPATLGGDLAKVNAGQLSARARAALAAAGGGAR